jgi:hypothetical protein
MGPFPQETELLEGHGPREFVEEPLALIAQTPVSLELPRWPVWAKQRDCHSNRRIKLAELGLAQTHPVGRQLCRHPQRHVGQMGRRPGSRGQTPDRTAQLGPGKGIGSCETAHSLTALLRLYQGSPNRTSMPGLDEGCGIFLLGEVPGICLEDSSTLAGSRHRGFPGL